MRAQRGEFSHRRPQVARVASRRASAGPRARIATAASKPAARLEKKGTRRRGVISSPIVHAARRPAQPRVPAPAGQPGRAIAQRTRGVVAAAQRHHAEREAVVSSTGIWCRPAVAADQHHAVAARHARSVCAILMPSDSTSTRLAHASPATALAEPARRGPCSRAAEQHYDVTARGGTPGSRRQGRWQASIAAREPSATFSMSLVEWRHRAAQNRTTDPAARFRHARHPQPGPCQHAGRQEMFRGCLISPATKCRRSSTTCWRYPAAPLRRLETPAPTLVSTRCSHASTRCATRLPSSAPGTTGWRWIH